MTDKNKIVKIFMMPQQFPCGPQSSCCGPTGQAEEEIQGLKEAISTELGCKVEVVNVIEKSQMKNYFSIIHLIGSFGPMALPIITLNDEVVSMGKSIPDEVIPAIREKIK